MGDDVVSISVVCFVMIYLIVGGHETLNILMNYFVSFFNVVCIIFILNWSFLMLFAFMQYFIISISIILTSFSFGLRWDFTIEKRWCVMLSWQNTCLLNIFKCCGVFLIYSNFWENGYPKISNYFKKTIKLPTT